MHSPGDVIRHLHIHLLDTCPTMVCVSCKRSNHHAVTCQLINEQRKLVYRYHPTVYTVSFLRDLFNRGVTNGAL